jgi:hypothetical protein
MPTRLVCAERRSNNPPSISAEVEGSGITSYALNRAELTQLRASIILETNAECTGYDAASTEATLGATVRCDQPPRTTKPQITALVTKTHPRRERAPSSAQTPNLRP